MFLPLLMATLTLMGGESIHAQCFSGINMPPDVCVSSSTTVSIGYQDTSTAVICRPQTTLGHSDRIFLPDGISCGENGCSYRSYVTFEDFEPGATITSVEDINYVRLNIEHSYIGDIYIGITCPSNQKASLMNWSGSGQSPCRDSIPSAHRGWTSGYNATGGTHLGNAYDHEAPGDKCDSTLDGNQPGVGWNYCWSNNTTAGISYAPGDAIIYRSANVNGGRIDSSNVSALTNFYQPNQSFTSLIGCPLNGDWYIEVIDGYSIDNGYIFGWDISLNANLVPHDECILTTREMIGPYTQRVNDSIFLVEWPDHVANDTTVAYTFRLHNSCNDSLDTTIYVNIHPVKNTAEEITDCPVIWHGHSYTRDTTILQTLTTQFGCDSIDTVRIHVPPSYEFHFDTSICDNQSLVFEDSTYQSAGSYQHLFHTIQGCDSLRILNLTVFPSYNLQFHDTICNNQDLSFEDTVLTTPGSYPFSFSTLHGCDSTRTLNLTVHDTSTYLFLVDTCNFFLWHGTTYTQSTTDTYAPEPNLVGCDSIDYLQLTIRYSSDTTIHDTIVENLLPYSFNGTSFTETVSDSNVIITNATGCDSIISYSLVIHWNVDTTLYDTLCNNALPFTWNNEVFDTTITVTTTLTRNIILLSHTGSDSLITMNLTVYPNYDHHLTTEICDDTSFLFGGAIYDTTGDYLDSLLSIHGCDSLSSLHLTVHPTYDHHTYDTLCDDSSLVFTGHTYDTTGVYSHLLTSIHQCDSLSTLHLQVWPTFDFHTFDTICDDSSRFFIDSSYRQTGNYLYSYLSQHTCDSLQTLHLKVYSTYNLHFYDTIYDGDHYTFEHTLFDTTGNYPFLLPAVFGCDSLRTLHLQRNRRTYNDSILCQNHLPLTWNGISFREGEGSRVGSAQVYADSIHLRGLNNIDSLVVMRVTAIDTSFSIDQLHTCDSLTWRNNATYFSTTDTPFVTLVNQWGCDSIRHLDLTVDHTLLFTDHQNACDSMLWIDGQTYYRDTLGPIDTLVTIGGCDSVVTLDLAVHYATYEEFIDTFCHGQIYYWRSFNVSSSDTFATIDFHLTDTLSTIYHCDSVLALHLTKMARPHIAFVHEADCGYRTYDLGINTDAGYIFWSSSPHDPLLDGNETLSLVTVAPDEPTEYLLYADYRQSPLCPITESITLFPVTIPEAELNVVPKALKYNSLEYNAYDISKEYQERSWYLDGIHQNETSRHLWGFADTDADSLVIALSVFNGQCRDTAISVVPILRVAIFAPNVFTPNLDENNRFFLSHHGILDGELFIYNREGLLVYRTTDFSNLGWDGGNCPQGNYVWRLDYHAIDFPSSLKSEIGTVLLLR